MRISAWHIIVLVVLVVLLFGANRLPDLARSVGQSLKIFKNEVKDLRDDDTPSTPAARDTAPGAPGATPTGATGPYTDRPDADRPSTERPYAERPEDSAPRNPQV